MRHYPLGSAVLNPTASRVATTTFRATPVISPAAVATLQAMPAQAIARAPAPISIDLIPSWCKGLPPLAGAPENLPAGAVAVVSFPFVKLTDAQVATTLQNVYGSGVGGPALVSAIAQATLEKLIVNPPNFIAEGWAPDTTASPNMTRGTLWLAFGFKEAVTGPNFVKFARYVMKAASGYDPAPGAGGTYSTLAAGSKPLGPGVISKVATGTSDVELQHAAISSAAGTIQGYAFLAFVFSLGGGPLGRLAATMPSTTSLLQSTSKVRLVPGAAQQLAALLQQVPAVATTVASAPPETCQAAVTAATQMATAIQLARTQIMEGMALAPTVMQMAEVEAQPGGGSITELIKSQVKAVVDAEVNGSTTNILINRQYMQCLYYNQAQTSLQRQLTDVSTGFAGVTGIAQAVIDGRDALLAGMTGVDAGLAQLQAAEEQSCLAWYMKKWNGMPVAAWMGGGALLFLGGAVFIRSRRKRAAAPAAVIKKNRRHRRFTARRHA